MYLSSLKQRGMFLVLPCCSVSFTEVSSALIREKHQTTDHVGSNKLKHKMSISDAKVMPWSWGEMLKIYAAFSIIVYIYNSVMQLNSRTLDL